jgi:hypothetical protein
VSFDQITYKGKPVEPDVDAGTATAYYAHMYRTDYQEVMQPGTGYRRHVCLVMGAWCWQNVREHPLDVTAYLKLKLRRIF